MIDTTPLHDLLCFSPCTIAPLLNYVYICVLCIMHPHNFNKIFPCFLPFFSFYFLSMLFLYNFSSLLPIVLYPFLFFTRLIPPSPPAVSATLEEENQDMVDYQLSNHNAPGPPPNLDPSASDNNNNNNNNHATTGNESPVSTSNESVFASRESIASRSPSSPDEIEGMTVTQQIRVTNQGYYPAVSPLVGLNGESASAESRYSIKRQLSAPSTSETLEKINDVKRFLQVRL